MRELRKRPGLAVTAILSLTLGIGATTAVFSVIYGLRKMLIEYLLLGTSVQTVFPRHDLSSTVP